MEKEKKIIEETIKAKGRNRIIDFLKVRKVEIISAEKIRDVDGGDIYKVIYKDGFNRINPITWVLAFSVIIIESVKMAKEIVSDTRMLEFTEYIKINKKDR